MRNLKLSVLLIFVAMLSACAINQPPTATEISSAYYGSEPTREEAQAAVKAYMGSSLVDPYSAMYENWKGPVKGWYHSGLAYGVSTAYGYRVCVDVNAKNQMGGYTGAKTYHFVINSGRVIQSVGGGRPGTVGWEEGYTACKTVY